MTDLGHVRHDIYFLDQTGWEIPSAETERRFRVLLFDESFQVFNSQEPVGDRIVDLVADDELVGAVRGRFKGEVVGCPGLLCVFALRGIGGGKRAGFVEPKPAFVKIQFIFIDRHDGADKRMLADVPHLDKLYECDFPSGAERTSHEADTGAGFALALTGIDDDNRVFFGIVFKCHTHHYSCKFLSEFGILLANETAEVAMTAQLTERENPELREERVFGDHPTRKVSVEKLITLSQVREVKNSVGPELKDSIDRGDMINQVNIALMSREQLQTYITFVNRVWRTEHDLSTFEDMILEDGSYALVIAGHSRTNAAREIAEEDPARDYYLMCHVHEITDPEDIIELQLDENIHSTPPVERQAMAIVESYVWGLESGNWSSQEEYLKIKAQKEGAKINKRQLRDALGFAQLPDDMRQLVLQKMIPYTAALEIGRSASTIIAHEMMRSGITEADLSEETDEDETSPRRQLDELVRGRILEIVTKIASSGMNTTAAKRHIQARVAAWKQALDEANGKEKDQDAGLFDLDFATPSEQANRYVKERRQASQGLLTEVVANYPERIQHLLRYAAGLEQLGTERARRELIFAQQLAIRAVHSSGLLVGAPRLTEASEDDSAA